MTVQRKAQSSGKTLVVYFGTPVQKRSGQVDGISSASRTAEGSTYKGNTQYIAELIRDETKADLFEIIPQQPYSDVYEKVRDLAEQEQERDARPKIKNKINNVSQYDTIYVGYPIWWSDMPQIMYTFFDTYDLSGKAIIPFCTHAGSGLSGTVGSVTFPAKREKTLKNALKTVKNHPAGLLFSQIILNLFKNKSKAFYTS